MTDTSFPSSYIATDAELETLIGDDKRTSAVALKAVIAADQAWYCAEATRHIDQLSLRGYRYELPYIENGGQKDTDEDGLAQVLEFPRIIDGVVCDWDYGTSLPIVPADVKRACLEEAIAIYARQANPMGLEIEKMQARGAVSASISGEGSESWTPGAANLRMGLASPSAFRLMKRYTGASLR